MGDKMEYCNRARGIFEELNDEYEQLEEGEPVLTGVAVMDIAAIIKEQIDEGKVSAVLISVSLKNGLACLFTLGGDSQLELLGLAAKTLNKIQTPSNIVHSKTGKYI